MKNEILRYMGHGGAPDAQMDALISSCLEKLAEASDPRHIMRQFPCIVKEDGVTVDTMNIISKDLAGHLSGCIQVYLFAATLGAQVDRLIAQRSASDSAQALCLQACAAVQIEEYCDEIGQGVSSTLQGDNLYLRPRFSPGYGDFDIAFQTDLLNMLQTHKLIGLTETASHMLTPLKSITALIGVSPQEAVCEKAKCSRCGKKNCAFRQTEGSPC